MNYEPEDYSIFINRYQGAYVASVLEYGPGWSVVEDTLEDAIREIRNTIIFGMEMHPDILPYTQIVHKVPHTPNTYEFSSHDD